MTQNFESMFRSSITHWFQPIFHLKDNKILGYEALLRDISQLKVSPADIFLQADKEGHRNDFDIISIKKASETFNNSSIPLFLNIFPSTILEKNFLTWWDINMPPNMSFVLELLESESIYNCEKIKAITKELKARGIKIALDDMGEGYSFLQRWIELNPDFVKLDRYFAENLSISPQKQKAVEYMVDLLADTTDIIIEGVEKEEDLNTAKALGIIYAQGYLLGRPSPRENL